MAIAFSKLPIIKSTASGSTRAELIASLVAILSAAGWDAVELSDGWRMTCTSPQGFQAALWLQDLGVNMLSIYGPAVSLRMSCADQSNPSPTHKLMVSAAREYAVIAGVCQVFISLPEISSEAAPDGYWGHHFAAGVPWINDDVSGPCLGRLESDVTAAWWLSGDGLHSFRNGWKHEGFNWAGYWSTDGLRIREGFNSDPFLQARVISLASAASGPAPALPEVVYGDGEPLLLDPLVAWGRPGSGGPPLIRGQIYDAVWSTQGLDLAETFETTEADEETAEDFTVTWECWSETHEEPTRGISSTWLGCLCLASGEAPAGGGGVMPSNYAY